MRSAAKKRLHDWFGVNLSVTFFDCSLPSFRRVVAVAALLAASSGLVFAESITGVVTNKTTNRPSAGDDVVLIRLAQGMQESTRTKTDAKGRFTLELPDQGVHLVRVTHDKATYFRPAPPGTQSIDIDVFDAAAKLAGVTSEADVMSVQTDESGKNLRVVRNFWVKNLSSPPKTLFSDRPFEFYLPQGAIVEGAAAQAAGGMVVKASPVPLNDPNHFAFIFPIRPCPSKDEAATDQHCGETRFQITYTLPYSGSFKFDRKLVMPTDAVMVMVPKSMKFEAGGGIAYQPVTEDTSAQTYVARSVEPAQSAGFTVSGTGQLPRDNGAQAAGDGQGGGQTAAQQQGGGQSAANDTRPGGGLGNPIDPNGNNDPWAKYKWWILSGLGLVMAAGAGFMLTSNPGKSAAAPATGAGAGLASGGLAPVAAGGSLLAAMKEELFALETDRMSGRLSESEYAEQKAALEVVIRRALNRERTDAATDSSNKVAGPAV